MSLESKWEKNGLANWGSAVVLPRRAAGAGDAGSTPLRSPLIHRSGLSVFVGKPQVPKDNSVVELALRGPLIGERLSSGSDGGTGARFTAPMCSAIAALKSNGIDVQRWPEGWLQACAKHGGQPPDDLSPWLPWCMTEARSHALMSPG